MIVSTFPLPVYKKGTFLQNVTLKFQKSGEQENEHGIYLCIFNGVIFKALTIFWSIWAWLYMRPALLKAPSSVLPFEQISAKAGVEAGEDY